MSFSSAMLILSMCSFFFLILFVMEGISDDGAEGIRLRYRSISGSIGIALITLVMFFLTRAL